MWARAARSGHFFGAASPHPKAPLQILVGFLYSAEGCRKVPWFQQAFNGSDPIADNRLRGICKPSALILDVVLIGVPEDPGDPERILGLVQQFMARLDNPGRPRMGK